MAIDKELREYLEELATGQSEIRTQTSFLPELANRVTKLEGIVEQDHDRITKHSAEFGKITDTMTTISTTVATLGTRCDERSRQYEGTAQIKVASVTGRYSAIVQLIITIGAVTALMISQCDGVDPTETSVYDETGHADHNQEQESR